MSNNAVRIPSVDAKDLYIANNLRENDSNGYSLLRQDGTVNIKKFINTLDYSLDLIKLREVYQKIYRNKYFSFWNHDHEFTTRCINVTFKYSNKEFNRFGKNLFIKFGYRMKDVELSDCVCIKNNELIAIQTDTKIELPIADELLKKNFIFRDGKYKVRRLKTLNTVSDLRSEMYEKGFYCDGVHYIRFKRSSGSSRVGKCLFIDARLYPMMHRYELLGLKIRNGQIIDLAALEAYIALTLSSIIDTITIDPKSILVVDDHVSIFKDEAIATEIIDEALATQKKEVVVKNSIWDGQSIADISIMGKYAHYGMMLLRNSFFKTCAFNGNIQKFFTDNDITRIEQLNGFTLAEDVSQIKLITTPSSIKFLKFGTLEEWLTRIDSTFGVVKHEKKTHFFDGHMVQSHYQLLNTLQLSKQEMAEFLQPTFDYMNKLKTEPAVLRYHIHYPDTYRLTNSPTSDKNEIIFKLMGLNEKFCKTGWYSRFLQKNIRSYKNNLRYGHVLIDGNYSTLLGNPLEMLLQSIGKFNGESRLGVGNVHSTRFPTGIEILGSRSPHVCVGNVLITNNVASEEIDTYFSLTEEIICINSIEENILQRLSGCDFDSDTMLITDNPILIKAAKKNYEKFLVPTSLVEPKDSSQAKRYYTHTQKTDLDIRTSVNKIGDIINLSQELQSYMWHLLNNGASYTDIEQLYFDVCQLDVMSNLEIDMAKKEFAISNVAELAKIKNRWKRVDESGHVIKPYFFAHIAKTKGYYDTQKFYMHHDTSMDYLEELVDAYRAPTVKQNKLPITDMLLFEDYKRNSARPDHEVAVINKIREYKANVVALFNPDNEMSGADNITRHQIYVSLKQELVEYINEDINPNIHTLYRILRTLDAKEYEDIRGFIITILFNLRNNAAFSLIEQSKTPVATLTPSEQPDVVLYDHSFAKTYKI